MNDTLQIAKGVLRDPVPIVNTTVILGLSAMEWELFFTIVLGFASIIWTVIKIANEWMKSKSLRNETKGDTEDT